MSAADKAFSAIKAILTNQERMDGLEEKLATLGGQIVRLADSHAGLRDRVAQIEGYLQAATGQPFSGSKTPRIEG